MYSQTEVFASSRGYRLWISKQDPHRLSGWIEIQLGRPSIKIHFQSICSGPTHSKFDFCGFINWDPYFDDITSAISGSYSPGHIRLKWVIMTVSEGEGSTVIGHGTDKLIRSTAEASRTTTNGQVPHPFNLEMLNISSDLIKIETIPT